MVTGLLLLLLSLQEAPPPAPAESTGPPASREYRIGPDDVLRMSVYGHPDLSVAAVVDADGTFKYPLLGRMQAAGLLPRELEAAITQRLAESYVRNPHVNVTVEVARSKRVFVMGEVAHPGWCPVWDCATVVEALARTGPLLATAGAEVVVLRPRDGAAILAVNAGGLAGAAHDAEVIRLDLDRLQARGAGQDVALRPSDTVFVPRAARVFVSGEVKLPGEYRVSAGATVRQAVSLAGGFARRAVRGHVRILRPADGRVQELKVGLEEEVRPGDTVVVERRLLF